MERQFKGIWIPSAIWEASDLSWNEKIVLMEIDSFTAAGKDCFISDEYIGNLVGVNERTARRMLSKLISLGYVKKTRFDGRKRYIESSCLDKIGRAEWTKMSGQVGQKCPHTNNKITNVSSIYIEDIENKRKRFVKPSVEEVAAYCEERKNGIDAKTFVDFYESKGWMVGSNKMKDWKAAVRTWEAKRKESSKRATTKKDESLADYYGRIIQEINGEYDTGIDDQ